MSVSSPFIHRPIATSLLGVAVMLGVCVPVDVAAAVTVDDADIDTPRVSEAVAAPVPVCVPVPVGVVVGVVLGAHAM